MWQDYFKLIKLKPGRVITHLFGELDFSRDNLSLEVLKKLYERDFPYLEITPLGKARIYGIPEIADDPSPCEVIPEKVKRRKRK